MCRSKTICPRQWIQLCYLLVLQIWGNGVTFMVSRPAKCRRIIKTPTKPLLHPVWSLDQSTPGITWELVRNAKSHPHHNPDESKTPFYQGLFFWTIFLSVGPCHQSYLRSQLNGDFWLLLNQNSYSRAPKTGFLTGFQVVLLHIYFTYYILVWRVLIWEGYWIPPFKVMAKINGENWCKWQNSFKLQSPVHVPRIVSPVPWFETDSDHCLAQGSLQSQ